MREFLDDHNQHALVLAGVPAVVVMLLSYMGGVRSLGALFAIGLLSYVILATTFLLLPKETFDLFATGKEPGREYSSTLSRLGMDLFKKPAKQTLVEMFNPDVDRDTMINVMVYLSSNGYVIDSGFKALLPEKQEANLREYMIDKGFAYPSAVVFEDGWAVNAAGRSIINRYLTHILMKDDID